MSSETRRAVSLKIGPIAKTLLFQVVTARWKLDFRAKRWSRRFWRLGVLGFSVITSTITVCIHMHYLPHAYLWLLKFVYAHHSRYCVLFAIIFVRLPVERGTWGIRVISTSAQRRESDGGRGDERRSVRWWRRRWRC